MLFVTVCVVFSGAYWYSINKKRDRKGWNFWPQISTVYYYSIATMAPPRQQALTSFFATTGNSQESLCRSTTKRTKRHRETGSHFHGCPLCHKQFPLHQLELHASDCNGASIITPNHKNGNTNTNDSKEGKEAVVSKHDNENDYLWQEPIPGLFVFENFITEEEEAAILDELDRSNESNQLQWKPATFNGRHVGKRWGVHCNLRERKVTAA
jgi:hypothetical protein